MAKAKTTHQQGFTLVELLLALAVFSFVLVFVTTAFLQLFRTYNRGVTRKEVNQSARALLDDITDKLRVVSDPNLVKSDMTTQGRLCIGSYSYVWNTLSQIESGTNLTKVNGQTVKLVRIDNDTGREACKTPINYNLTGFQASSMFSERVAIQTLTVTPQTGGVTGLFGVAVTASTSQVNFLESILSGKCRADSFSTSYCARVTLQETVGLRNR